MKILPFMTPAIFCAVISFLALLTVVRSSANRWQVLFFAALPACFIIMGGLAYQLSRENARLRRRLARLEQKLEPRRPGDSRAAVSAEHGDEEV